MMISIHNTSSDGFPASLYTQW